MQLKLKQRNPLRKTYQNETPQGLPLHWNQGGNILVVPVEQPEDQAPLYPPNQPN